MITTWLGLLCLSASACMFIVFMNTGWRFDILFFNLGGAGMAFLVSTLIINRRDKKREINNAV